MPKTWLLAALFLLGIALQPLQAQRPWLTDFTLRGDTYLTDDDCFRLTEARDYRSGSIWYKKPISLLKPFAVELSIMAGCDDAGGADGMVFVMCSQTNRLGYVGEGIGFSGLRPSVGIEIDTWRNYHLDDPADDHLAIMLNGRVGHFQNLVGPVTIPNIEDCARHRFFVIWDPNAKKLSVEIDGREVISAQYDLLNDVFLGQDQIYWGVTAATGRYNNIHEVCFDRLTEGELPEKPKEQVPVLPPPAERTEP
ncbi:MAG: L-type lectin-domain containing protein [Bacteroidota bacterium]